MKFVDFLACVPDFVCIQVMDFNYGSPNLLCSFFSQDLRADSVEDLLDSSVISVEPSGGSITVTLIP